MTTFSIGMPKEASRAYSLTELCAHEHTEFVRCAYLTVLGRQPDLDGMEFYLRQLDEGVSKLTILRQLRRSLEAANHDPGIAGFDRSLRRHHRGNLPLVGRAFRLFNRVEIDDAAAREHRAILRRIGRIEARLLAMHIDCIDRIEELRTSGGDIIANRRPTFGLSPAGQRGALPWTVNGAGKSA